MIQPTSIYGESKYLAERYIVSFAKKTNLKYAILRYFNVCGAEQKIKHGQIKKNGQLFKNLALEAIKKKPCVKIFGINFKTKDGTCERDYIHVSDISQIHYLSLKYLNSNEKNLLLNCGYGNNYSVKKIIFYSKKYLKKILLFKLKKKKR